MTRLVRILSKTRILDKFFKVDEATLQHELFNGQLSPVLTRLSFERGDSTAALLHDPQTDHLILVEQFRYPTYGKGDGWLLEIVAGVLAPGEDPTESIRREITEEAGYSVQILRPIGVFFLSPGGSSERIHLFYAQVDSARPTGQGGGLPGEGEYTRRVLLPTRAALDWLDKGEIHDAKTIIALQWLRLRAQEALLMRR